MNRCAWVTADPLYVAYHDEEWGVPNHHDQSLFEFLVLEGMQAGLSWFTILKKRENFRLAFDDFQASIVATYNEAKISELLCTEGIVRNRLKVRAAIQNARAFLDVQSTYGSFDSYIWGFVEGTPQIHDFASHHDVPSHSSLSDAMSKDLKKRGFSFVGTTICYAFMQATGMVMDHDIRCFRHLELQQNYIPELSEQ